jgi:peptidoglycan hydrolase CwlO-like protein
MVKFDIDIKDIFIIVLGVVIITMIILRPSNDISMYEEEINILNQKNKILIEINDSISTANNLLENQISLLEVDVETVNSKLIDNEKEINKLKRNKGEIYKHVNSLDVDGVTSGLSDYLKRKH